MKKSLLLASTAIALSFYSCQKDYNANGGPYTLASAMASLAVKSKTVTINATTGGSFVGNSGSRYIFPPNAFRTSSGALVSGDIQVETREYLKKSDMLFSGVMPMTTTGTLVSGGEIFMHPTQNGQVLAIDPAKNFQVNMPRMKNDDGMQLFTGTPNDSTGKGGGGGVLWWQANASTGSIAYNGDTISILSNSIDFCNADKFLASPNYQSFTVTPVVNGAALTDSISGYSIYDNYNGMWPMFANGTVFNENHVPDIPVHFVVIAIIKGHFYGGILGATPNTGKNYTVTLTKTTPTAFKAKVDAL